MKGLGRGCFLTLAVAGLCSPGPAAADAPAMRNWVEGIIESTDIGGLALSPGGSQLAFRTTRAVVEGNRYELRWNLLDLDTGRVTDLGGAGEAIIRDPGLVVTEPPIWPADGRWIHFRSLVGGDVQLWRAATNGAGTQKLTDEPADVERIEPMPDGSGLRIGLGPNRQEIEQAEEDEYRNGILIDASVDPAQNLHRGALINGRPRTQRLTGRWFERTGVLGDRPLRFRRLDFKSERLIAGQDRDPIAREAPSVSGGKISFEWVNGAATLKVDRGRRGFRSCTAKPCRSERIAWAAWRPGRDQILFATSDRSHAQTLWRWDVAMGSVRKLVATQGLVGGGSNDLPCAVSHREAVCVVEAAASPPMLERINLDTGARRVVFDPNAGLRKAAWPNVERLRWKGPGGQIFTAVMFLPDGEVRRAPMFLNYYRCEGFVRGGVGDEWPFAAFAKAGMVSICINTTRIDGPQDAVGQYRAALGGIEALVDLLDRRELIDRSRIGIGGLSFGSEVAMWAAIHSDLVAAISVASPQFEPSAFWFNGIRGRDYRETLRKVWGLGAPEETPERWKLISPALNTDRIRAPLLMQLAEQESRYAIELHSRLNHSATPIEVIAYPDEAHIKVQPWHRLAAYQRNLDWFRFWLMGEQDPCSRKNAQYERWRSLGKGTGGGIAK